MAAELYAEENVFITVEERCGMEYGEMKWN